MQFSTNKAHKKTIIGCQVSSNYQGKRTIGVEYPNNRTAIDTRPSDSRTRNGIFRPVDKNLDLQEKPRVVRCNLWLIRLIGRTMSAI
jgi:hypothetical protein